MNVSPNVILTICGCLLLTGCNSGYRPLADFDDNGGLQIEYNVENLQDLFRADVESGLNSIRRRLIENGIVNFELEISDPSEKSEKLVADYNNEASPELDSQFPSRTLRIRVAASGKIESLDKLNEKMSPIEEEISAVISHQGQLEFLVLADAVHDVGMVEPAMSEKEMDVYTELDEKKVAVAKWIRLGRNDEDNVRYIPGTNDIIRSYTTKLPFEIPDEILSDYSTANVKLTKHLEASKTADLEILAKLPQPSSEIDNRHLDVVQKTYDERGMPAIAFKLNAKGGKHMQRLTSHHKPVNQDTRSLAIVIDNELLIAPRIESVFGSEIVLNGAFEDDEITDLVGRIRNSNLLEISPHPRSVDYVLPASKTQSDSVQTPADENKSNGDGDRGGGSNPDVDK